MFEDVLRGDIRDERDDKFVIRDDTVLCMDFEMDRDQYVVESAAERSAHDWNNGNV